MDTEGMSTHSIIHVAYKDDSTTISTSIIGTAKSNCEPKEFIFTVYNVSSSIILEPAARVESESMTVNMHKLVAGYDAGILTTNYRTYLREDELHQLAGEKATISGYPLLDLGDAINEYFERTSDLVSCG